MSPIEQRVILKLLLVTYKALNDPASDYTAEGLHHYSPTLTLHSSSFITLLNNRVILKLLLVTCKKALIGLAPDYFTERRHHYSPTRTLHSSSFITPLNNRVEQTKKTEFTNLFYSKFVQVVMSRQILTCFNILIPPPKAHNSVEKAAKIAAVKIKFLDCNEKGELLAETVRQAIEVCSSTPSPPPPPPYKPLKLS